MTQGTSGNRHQATARPERVDAAAIVAGRDQLMRWLSATQPSPHQASVVEKLDSLLHRHWGPASWAGRANLLRTAQWLTALGAPWTTPPPAFNLLHEGKIRRGKGTA